MKWGTDDDKQHLDSLDRILRAVEQERQEEWEARTLPPNVIRFPGPWEREARRARRAERAGRRV